jgi:hypothetical protein
LEALVKEEQLAPEFRFTRRYDLEFCVRKGQTFFQGRTIETFNLRGRPNTWGEVHIKESPDETTRERDERNKEIT